MKLEAEYYYRLRDISRLKDPRPKLLEFLKEVEPEKKRTNQQNKGLHLNCSMIAEKLNDAGLDMRQVIKPEINIPWTTISVKEYIWKPIQKAMYNKKSTTELKKHEEIDKIHEVVMRELGEKYEMEYHDFPHRKKESVLEAQKIEVDYPEEDINPKF